jgi:hypothetical protein
MGPKVQRSQAPATLSKWHWVALGALLIFVPWLLYLSSRPGLNSHDHAGMHVPSGDEIRSIFRFSQTFTDHETIPIEAEVMTLHSQQAVVDGHSMLIHKPELRRNSTKMPVLGPIPTNGAVPLYGAQHSGGDAVFALACNYPKNFYERFVGSLRKSKFEGDVVLAVSPPAKMKPGVEKYIQQTRVIPYAFEVDCMGVDNCKLKDDFLGYPDPRPYRTFANIRYALYEYWLVHYSDQSYILILDFRDTFFQVNPFQAYGVVAQRPRNHYELQLYAENYKVKNIGKCPFNSLWIARCFGKPALEDIKEKAVICSGSTLGSFTAIDFYITTMLNSMDRVKCWLKGIESDQGYQNYLFYNGYFNHPTLGNATLNMQGEGVVNTIGAMNGFRLALSRGIITCINVFIPYQNSERVPRLARQSVEDT